MASDQDKEMVNTEEDSMNYEHGVLDWDQLQIERVDVMNDEELMLVPPNNGADDTPERCIQIGMEFDCVDDVRDCWRKYGKRHGFGVRIGYYNKRKKDGVITNIVYVCYKEGFRKDDKRVKDISRQRCQIRCGCKVKVNAALNSISGKYTVTEFVGTHNHELESSETSHLFRSYRNVSDSQAHAINIANDSGLTPKATQELLIREAGGREHLGFIKEDQKTYLRNKRKKNQMSGELGSIMKYFEVKKMEDSSFSHEFDFDESGLVSNIFWVDGRMKVDYIDFGDVITFNTTYGTNKELRPLGVFTGFNHHREMTIFGVALLYDETVESFVWLFETFLRAHGGKKPQTIFSDQDAAMANALTLVMGDTYHGLCTWHLNQNALKHLSCFHDPESDLLGDFSRCIYEYTDIDVFEAAWNNMLQKHNLEENSCLKRTYALKGKWARCFMKYAFTLGIRSTQLSESLNKDLKNHLNCTLNIGDFFTHFDRVVDDKRDKELAAEFNARQQIPMLSIDGCPILQKASKRYTPSIFNIFQEKYKHSMIAIVKDKENIDMPTWFTIVLHGALDKEFQVLRVSDDFFSCSCMMFESEGYLCSHILRVFRYFDILELPEKYILSRWERKARRLHHSKFKDIGQSVTEWNERMHSFFLRMVYQAAKSEVARGLMEDIFKQNMDKIYDASMGDEITKSNDISKKVECAMENLKGLKKKEGKRRTRRMKSLHETRPKKAKNSNVKKDLGGVQITNHPQESFPLSLPDNETSHYFEERNLLVHHD